MKPEEQLKKLHSLMKELNDGSVTKEEVKNLFGVLSKAIKDIRVNLESKIQESNALSGQSVDSVLKNITQVQQDWEKKSTETGVAWKKDLKILKNELSALIGYVESQIPRLPDFEGMLAEFEKKIPTVPEQWEYEAGRNIEIEDRVITNTNPKIIVSRTRPEDAEENDIWIRPNV